VGVTDGPRGGFWDADGNLYLADFYSNAIYHYAYYEEEMVLMNHLLTPEPF